MPAVSTINVLPRTTRDTLYEQKIRPLFRSSRRDKRFARKRSQSLLEVTKTTTMPYSWRIMSRKSTMLLLATVVLIDFFAAHVTAEWTAVVKTTNGPVRGEILTTVNSVKYAAFKGMRYGKAPLGHLRFKPPIAVDPWTETLNATAEGADCIQFDAVTQGSVKGSEDCLFINVYTPVTDLAKPRTNLKSVMVWFYGGGFTTGTSSRKLYNPDYILGKDVVFVSLNYRLGPLGFLSLGHRNATGNAGLKDQVLALKWVQANIEKFGGNPKNVTIFGQSAGAISVSSHVLSEASAGLFHAAISMSGVPLNPRSYDTPETTLSRAVKLGALLGTASTDKKTLLEAFYRASAFELVNASLKLNVSYPTFGPTIEDQKIATDVFLSRCSIDKYTSGNFTKVPQILGFTDQETAYYAKSLQSINVAVTAALEAVDAYGMKRPESLVKAKDVIDSGTGKLADIALDAVVNTTSDIVFKAQIDQTQQMIATENGKPVYYYHVSFYTNRSLHNILYNNSFQGAAHIDDLVYLFYFPAANYSTDPTDPTRRNIERVCTMWTNFAKYGNPTPHWVHDEILNITWPNSGSSGLSLDIGTELNIGPRPINRFTRLVQSQSWPHLRKINGCY